MIFEAAGVGLPAGEDSSDSLERGLVGALRASSGALGAQSSGVAIADSIFYLGIISGRKTNGLGGATIPLEAVQCL